MRLVNVKTDGFEAAAQAVRRSVQDFDFKIETVVRDIIADVRARGDIALLELGRRFDCPTLESLEVTADEWDRACVEFEEQSRRAVEAAAALG